MEFSIVWSEFVEKQLTKKLDLLKSLMFLILDKIRQK